MRTIVIGDIHGCLVELKELLRKLNYSMFHDKVVAVGDLIDKGPHSYEVVELACGWDWAFVMGNHDEKAVRYWKHELKRKADPKYKNPMRLDDERKALFDRLIADGFVENYITKGQKYARLNNNWVVVHGGFVSHIPIEEQDPKQTCRMRYVHKDTGKMLSLNDDLSQPPDSVFWTEKWHGGDNIVYGHTAASLTDIVVNEEKSTFGIDTGCAYGGRLTALVFESDFHGFEVVQVQAKQQYAPYYEQGGE